jgi:sulfoxide reductase heme-binding subunit YedZ
VIPPASSVIAAAGPSPLWYLTRGTGLVALVLLTATLVLGIVTSGRWSSQRWPRFVNAELHRRISLLVIVLLGVHILTAELDTYAPVGWLAVLVPFASAYRPLWLGLGTLAFDLLLALIGTSLLREHLGYRVWRTVHWAAYACWPIAVVHGLGTGTDARAGWTQLLTVACALTVIAALAARLGQGWRKAPALRLGAGGAIVAVALATGSWAAAGPLRPGWSRRAGTPPSLIASATPAAGPSTPLAAGRGASTGAPAAGGRSDTASVPLPFESTIGGTLAQQGPGSSGSVVIVIDGHLTGTEAGTIHFTLRGAAAGGGVSLRSSAVELTLDGGKTFTGEVLALDGSQILARVGSPGQPTIALEANLQIDPAEGTVTGTVSATLAGSGQ